VKRCEHTFQYKEMDWGFNEFIKLDSLKNPDNGFVTDVEGVPTVLMEVTVKDNSHEVFNPPPVDSKKETGFVGLKNQGATCYLNSLLQTYFHLSYFRFSVYQMPISSDTPKTSKSPSSSKKDDVKSIPFALQRLFYNLQYSKEPLKTEELTKSFGWTQMDSFTQHDIQELNRVLCDNLETKMQHTPAEGTMQKLFKGKVRNYIKCLNVNYESTREEDFYDLQLCVSGCRDIYDSFRQELDKETLEGENKYNAGSEHGMQDAEKGIQYVKFPPVLMLHLKRFEYDVERGTMKKVIDEHRFYEEINLGQFISKDGRPPAMSGPTENLETANPDDVYVLHSVLVHCGGTNGGHYYAFVRPGDLKTWLKFDDDKVSKATTHQATVENYGGTDKDKFWLTVHTIPCAYMLVYVQKSQWNKIVYPFQDRDVPQDLKDTCEREVREQERQKKEKQEEYLYYCFRVATDQKFRQYDDKQLHNDLYDFDLCEDSFRFKKHDTWGNLKRVLHERHGIPPDRQRLWKWCRRNNRTYRPDTPLLPKKSHGDHTPLKDVMQHATSHWQSDKIDLFIETPGSRVPDGAVPYDPPTFDPLTDEHIFLLFKLYDPKVGKISYMGHTTARLTSKPSALLPFLNSLIGRQTDLPLLMFEEVRANMIERLDVNKTLKDLELQHGDIVVYQLPIQEGHNLQFPLAPDIFKYLEKRTFVRFAWKDKPEEILTTAELQRDMDFHTVCTKLYKHLKKAGHPLQYPSTHLRLFTSTGKHDFPSTVKNLKEMLATSSNNGGVSDLLLFDELSIPITEYESKKHLTVVFFSPKVQEGESHKLLLEPTDVVKDATRQLRSLLDVQGDIQLVDVDNHEIRRVFKSSDPVSGIQSPVRAEVVPEKPPGGQTLVQVVHFDSKSPGGAGQCHGHPFTMYVGDLETAKAVRDRIRARLDMRKAEDFKLCVLMGTQVQFPPDEDARVLSMVKAMEDKYPQAGVMWRLGMDHRDTKRRTDKTQNSIVIYN